MNNKIGVLLTGTISPHNVPFLKRDNISERENDYEKSLRRWILYNFPLVFVENSNYSSQKINSFFRENPHCEYLQFKSKKSHLGKGNGEAEIIDYALKYSNLLKDCDIIIKITGRLFVKNITQIITSFNENEEQFVSAMFYDSLKFADSKLIIAKNKFYTDYLINELSGINESEKIYFEHMFARSIHRCIADGYKWSLPKEMPLFIGYSGTGDIPYKHGILYRIKHNGMLRILNYLLSIRP